MVKWNDKETDVAHAHIATDDTHRSDNIEQKKTRFEKLLRDLAVVASDPSNPKTRKTVEHRLMLLRRDPAGLEAFQKKVAEVSEITEELKYHREITEELKYHGESLPITPESESVRYLGNALETIRETYMGRGLQDGRSVPGSVEDTSPPHFADSRRRYPNTPCPCTKSEEDASISEEYSSRIPQHGGLEAHSYRRSTERHRGLVHFPRHYSMARATDN
jgi:hypothetical protein